jgi:hypothetical protein
MKITKILSLAAILVAVTSPARLFAIPSDLVVTDTGTLAPTGASIYQSTNNDGNPTDTTSISPRYTGSSHGVTETFYVTSAQTDPNSGPYDDAAQITNIYVQSKTAVTGTYDFTLEIGEVTGNTVSDVTTITEDNVTLSGTSTKSYLDFSLPTAYLVVTNGTYFFNISSSTSSGVNGSGLILSSINASGVSGVDYGVGATLSNGTLTDGTGAYTFFIDTVPVPEPADWALVPVIATLGFFGLRRFKQHQQLAFC